jgi:hypothetical protein
MQKSGTTKTQKAYSRSSIVDHDCPTMALQYSVALARVPDSKASSVKKKLEMQA